MLPFDKPIIGGEYDYSISVDFVSLLKQAAAHIVNSNIFLFMHNNSQAFFLAAWAENR
jgi:hypothetical protein